eukprot:5522616-Amphidinium_carterae.2
MTKNLTHSTPVTPGPVFPLQCFTEAQGAATSAMRFPCTIRELHTTFSSVKVRLVGFHPHDVDPSRHHSQGGS